MTMHTGTIYVRNSKTGALEPVRVDIEIDVQPLLQRLGAKAWRNRSKTSGALHGIIRVEARASTRREPETTRTITLKATEIES